MKRLTLILMAGLLMLGMTQCKKEQTNANANAEGEWVNITVKVDAGDRHIVYPGTGAVVYSDGDKIYVGNNGHYVGTLTYADGAFTGQIQSPSTADYLHFYFIGGEYTGTLTAGTTESFNWSIADQSEKLPVLSYGHSTQKYTDATATYGCTLENQCALVKFDVTSPSTTPTCILGLNNKVTVDFSTNGFAYSQVDNGLVMLPGETGERWAILLPQAALEEGDEGTVYTMDGNYTGTRPAIPAITANDYLHEGFEMTVSTAASSFVSGKFTINANGGQVYFSQGNLQYQASTDTWQFAEHQYDYVGDANSNISQTNSGWIDLFGWGTSGWHDNSDPYNVNYQPWSTSTSTVNTEYNYDGYGPSTNMPSPNLTGSSANYDWGVCNPISNGGNQPNQWRTLTHEEWAYVLNSRTTSSGIRYAKANVNNVNGVILLPDDWSTSYYYALSYTNNGGASYSSNTITAQQWSTLEQHGAVFLPAAGYRYEASVRGVGSGGDYWSASYNDNGYAYYVGFGGADLGTDYYSDRSSGQSVRLVAPAEN